MKVRMKLTYNDITIYLEDKIFHNIKMFKQLSLFTVPDFESKLLLNTAPRILAFINNVSDIPGVKDLAKLHNTPIVFIVRDKNIAIKC